MRVRFLADFDWSPPEFGGRVTTAYKRGREETVTRACGEAAIKTDKAEEIAVPSRDDPARTFNQPRTGGLSGNPKRLPKTKK